MTASRRIACQFAALLGLTLATMGAQSFEMRGFRSISWGDGVEYLGQAEELSAQGEVKCYRRDRENLLFGDATLAEVRYCFHRDRLFMVELGATVERKVLQSEFQRTYGAPDVQDGRRAGWGNSHSGSTRAELVAAQGGSRLRLLSNKFDPSLPRAVGQAGDARSPSAADL